MRVERPGPARGQEPRITELWAWIALDPMTDTEGIVGAQIAGEWMPLVTSIRATAERMRPAAEAAMRATEHPQPVLRLRRFVQVEDDV